MKFEIRITNEKGQTIRCCMDAASVDQAKKMSDPSMGVAEDMEEFFLLVCRSAGLRWVDKVYLIPEFRKDFYNNNSAKSD